jgi:hypothetical protein
MTWPPRGLGDPSVTGQSGGLRYAYYEGKRRLAVSNGDSIQLYETSDQRIDSFATSEGGTLTFVSENGRRKATELRLVATTPVDAASTTGT